MQIISAMQNQVLAEQQLKHDLVKQGEAYAVKMEESDLMLKSMKDENLKLLEEIKMI